MQAELIEFSASDETKLNGFIIKKNDNNKEILIFVHGMSSDCFKNRGKVIAEELQKENIDTLIFDNRGSNLVKYLRKENSNEKTLGGTTYEDVEEGYFDIKGAIQTLIERGYTKIHLAGHSLGSTKVVYTYNRLKNEKDEILKYIKSVILLSLIDIPRAIKIYSGENFSKNLEYAEQRKSENKILELMPLKSFIHPISVKSYLRYVKYNEEIDFAKYHEPNNEFRELNNIDVPIFMRWGNKYEMIEEDAKDLVCKMNKKIKNNKKDINYIDGADHGYNGKEEILAKQIKEFLC